jgi:hypothetical protein
MFRMILHFLVTLVNLAIPCLVVHTWTTKVSIPGLTALPADLPLPIQGDYGVEVDIGTIDKTKIQSIVINADLAAMDVYTNDAAGSTGQHFALAANKSVAWNNQIPNQVNPITTNISKFFANNAGVKAGVLRVGILLST